VVFVVFGLVFVFVLCRCVHFVEKILNTTSQKLGKAFKVKLPPAIAKVMNTFLKYRLTTKIASKQNLTVLIVRSMFEMEERDFIEGRIPFLLLFVLLFFPYPFPVCLLEYFSFVSGFSCV
jgi:hypothetical protein